MQAIILAAGESSRFHPFNSVHKSMVRVLGKPILEHTIKGLKKENIKKIVLIVGKDNVIKGYFGDGKNFGVSIDYVVQSEPLGAGNALLLAEQKIKENFLLLNAHRIDAYRFANSLSRSKLANRSKAVILVKQKENTQIHGVLKFEKNQVLGITEKPAKGTEPSNLCVVGIYLLSCDFLKILKNTPPEHYQLEKAITAYCKKNMVTFVETKDDLITLKYPWDLLDVKNYLLKNVEKFVGKNSSVAKSAELAGEVFIGDGVSIMENVVIKGPCYIGENAFIGNNAVLRGGVDIGGNAVVGANMEIKNSIVMRNSTTHSGYIGDSVIGQNCKIAAGFLTANVRLDRANVKVDVKGEKADTMLKMLGVMVGENCNMGIKVTTMPGVIIGRNVVVGASTTVMGNISDNTKYYTVFKEIVSKREVKKPVVLFDIDYTLFDTKTFKKSGLTEYRLYAEVKSILEKMKDFAEIGIFSEGENNFQRGKLKKTFIHSHFEENDVHIFLAKEDNLQHVLDKYAGREFFLVDDKLTILYNAKMLMPSVVAIWIKRGPFAESQKELEGFKPDAEIKNLSDILSIIRKA
ncbi:MAG: NTP transferase domain-containing protein [Candidatus Levybacteria bacterium]|nr:NTP transferase domain-containing protein [Candidatus Levybacteria bacterium]